MITIATNINREERLDGLDSMLANGYALREQEILRAQLADSMEPSEQWDNVNTSNLTNMTNMFQHSNRLTNFPSLTTTSIDTNTSVYISDEIDDLQKDITFLDDELTKHRKESKQEIDELKEELLKLKNNMKLILET